MKKKIQSIGKIKTNFKRGVLYDLVISGYLSPILLVIQVALMILLEGFLVRLMIGITMTKTKTKTKTGKISYMPPP